MSCSVPSLTQNKLLWQWGSTPWSRPGCGTLHGARKRSCFGIVPCRRSHTHNGLCTGHRGKILVLAGSSALCAHSHTDLLPHTVRRSAQSCHRTRSPPCRGRSRSSLAPRLRDTSQNSQTCTPHSGCLPGRPALAKKNHINHKHLCEMTIRQ